MLRAELSIGDKVVFGRGNGQKTLGEVVKLNPKKAKVRTLELRGVRRAGRVGEVWGVPYDMISLASDDGQPLEAPKRAEVEILKDLCRVEGDLSPENLSCDGELSRAQTQRRYRALMTQKRKLIKELGRIPTDQELWGITLR